MRTPSIPAHFRTSQSPWSTCLLKAAFITDYLDPPAAHAAMSKYAATLDGHPRGQNAVGVVFAELVLDGLRQRAADCVKQLPGWLLAWFPSAPHGQSGQNNICPTIGSGTQNTSGELAAFERHIVHVLHESNRAVRLCDAALVARVC